MNLSGNDYINTLTITVDAVICHYLYLSFPFSYLILSSFCFYIFRYVVKHPL